MSTTEAVALPKCGGRPPVHSEEFIASARKLWDDGGTASVIGALLGISKDAVIGIAHRNGFPPRPSPIKRRAGT